MNADNPERRGLELSAFFLKIFIGESLIYSVILVSAMQQVNQLYIHISCAGLGCI